MFGGRKYLFKRPAADDDYEREGRLVKAKPIGSDVAKKLGAAGLSFGGKDFVTGSARSQAEFYGQQQVVDNSGDDSKEADLRPLTADERNKLNARILKAQMKGNEELAEKLRKQLESGVSCAENEKQSGSSSGTNKEVMLTRVDKRTGLVMPAMPSSSYHHSQSTSDPKKRRMAIDEKYEERKEMKEMIEEERMTSADDQIGMFNHLAKATSSQKADDDFVVDDIFMSHKKKGKHDRRETNTKHARDIAEHKRFEQTLESCVYCIDSRKLQKNAIVAIGLKIWRKGLVAMFASRGEDCVFVETAKNVKNQPHMHIECIPIPEEIGQSAPIYFKKAIVESEGEWTDNKKLVDLSKVKDGDIRRAIPKGFSYVSVDFGLQKGYAHVIENEHNIKSSFAKEIIGGMLDLNHNLWRKPRLESFEEITAKTNVVKPLWKPFDWTEKVKARLKDDSNHDEDHVTATSD